MGHRRLRTGLARTAPPRPRRIRKQQDELVEILDKLKAANFNTVLFQTRTRGDVLYKSSIEPYNSILTGKTDGNPGYDPLAFAVAECHKRGMECHAWMVTIPLGNRKHVAALGKDRSPNANPLSAYLINASISSIPDIRRPKNT